MTMNAPVTRRPITDKAEIDRVAGEEQERIARVQEEQRTERERDQKVMQEMDEYLHMGVLERPKTLGEYERFVGLRHPFWNDVQVGVEARLMMQRAPYVDKAYEDGLKVGRDLRQRQEYNVGWWWDSLQPLIPVERRWVIERVKREINK